MMDTTTAVVGFSIGVGALVVLFFWALTKIDTGTYRWTESSLRHSGPPPVFGVVVRPGGYSWVRIELVIAGKAFWIHWGE